jgi:chemotaxis-related protein WspB
VTLLTLSVDDRRYGLDIGVVRAVLPVPPLRRLDHVPAWVRGLFVVRGRLVPVLDVMALHAGRSARAVFGTRVILVDYPDAGGTPRLLGLLAEGVTDMVEVESASLRPTGVAQDGAPWLGKAGVDAGGDLVQVIEIGQLLPVHVQQRLFRDGPSGRAADDGAEAETT